MKLLFISIFVIRTIYIRLNLFEILILKKKKMKILSILLILSSVLAINCQTYGYLLLVQEIAGTACLQKTCTNEYALNLP